MECTWVRCCWRVLAGFCRSAEAPSRFGVESPSAETMRRTPAVLCLLLPALGCAKVPPEGTAAASAVESAPLPPPSAPALPVDAAAAPKRPRLSELGIPLTETLRMPRFEWRRWQELSWQAVAESLPALPAPAVGEARGCPTGMLRVQGAFVLDERGRDDTDRVTALQNQACTFWRTADHGENGLCDRFDPEKWREKRRGLPTKPMDLCIDRYEYPNAHGEFPLVVVTYSEAQAFCEREKKRLCTENEWTFACEGEEAWPYPYGFERDPTKCNIGVLGPGPTKDMFSPRTTKDTARGIDLSWRGRRSGELASCKSPFGVMDLTGNVDEWTTSSWKVDKKMIMKGGHWGPARQRCRPATRGHGPYYVRYDQGFRCCSSP